MFDLGGLRNLTNFAQQFQRNIAVADKIKENHGIRREALQNL